MGLVRFTDCGQTEHELTYYGVLWDVESYEAEETNPKWIWYIEIQDDRLLYPIIQPCNCNWNLRWSRNGTVIKEAKVKYFTDEAYKLYCDQFLYIKELGEGLVLMNVITKNESGKMHQIATYIGIEGNMINAGVSKYISLRRFLV